VAAHLKKTGKVWEFVNGHGKANRNGRRRGKVRENVYLSVACFCVV